MKNNEQTIHLKELEGCWYIHYSDFPMWLKGDKQNPSLNYSLLTKGNIQGLKDEVIYYKHNKKKSIQGFDKPLNKENTSFLWRGAGLLCLLSSQWSILFLSPNKDWAIIGFKKTLFTPKGYDVISKEKVLNEETSLAIKTQLKALQIESKLIIIPQT